MKLKKYSVRMIVIQSFCAVPLGVIIGEFFVSIVSNKGFSFYDCIFPSLTISIVTFLLQILFFRKKDEKPKE